MRKRILTVLLVLSLAVSALAIPAYAANAPATSNNTAWWGQHDYSGIICALPVRSHLVAENNGYTRVENVVDDATGGQAITIDRYDQNLKFLSHKELKLELPIYGGIYFGTNYNFVVCGQNNKEENDQKEVIRVIRYSKDWQRQAAASLYGANTTDPFNAGSLDMVESGNMLYIRTCHEMYRTWDDGLNHQANVQLSVRIPDMMITEQRTWISNDSTGYVSHSFNQMILKDGDDILAVDHGDAHPRAVVLFRYNHSAGAEQLAPYPERVLALPITGNTGNNDTGLTVGSFQSSDFAYLIAGNSVEQKNGADLREGQRNIYITVTPKGAFNESATQVKWLTNYRDGDHVSVTTPYLIKITQNSFMMIWEENNQLRYALLDGNGNKVSKTYQAEGRLSGCEPVVANGKITWYITENSKPGFYQISCSNPEDIQFIHEHEYYGSFSHGPSIFEPGSYTKTCSLCHHEKSVELPVLNDKDYTVKVEIESTCTTRGEAWYTCKIEGFEDVTYYSYLPELGHDYKTVVTKPTCLDYGYTTYTCKRCGDSYTSDETSPTDHNFSEWIVTEKPTYTTEGYERRTCSGCTAQEIRPVPALHFPFTDVHPGDYYHIPVLWALNEGVTAGISANRFGPHNACTRAQIVTFLWSATGKPEPKSVKNPFQDVHPTDYYYKAVLWAVENNITAGVTANRFGPGQTCTRAQAMTFLWASQGRPLVRNGTYFIDVDMTDYYYDAVRWAVTYGITAGVDSVRFGPNQNCTRAQIVTFLYEAIL